MSAIVTRTFSAVTDSGNGDPIDADDFDGDFDAFVTAINKKFLVKSTAPGTPSDGQTWVDIGTNPPPLKWYDDTNTAWVTGITLTGTPNPFTAGMIIIWSGTIATIPSGWVLCNGSNSTPDLRDKMVICAKQDDGSTPKTNVTGSLTQSGGAATHTITEAEMKAHTHTVNYDTVNITSGADRPQQVQTGSGNYATGSKGSGSAISIMNPYYALAFIMKT